MVESLGSPQNNRARGGNMKKYAEMENKVFGRWKVIGDADNYRSGYVKAKCMGCGIIKEISVSTLRLGKSNGCQSCRGKGKKYPERADSYLKKLRTTYIGTTINAFRIHDVRNAYDKKGERYYELKCECSCGDLFWTKKERVINGTITTCGHNRDKQLEHGRVVHTNEMLVDGTLISAIDGRRKTNKNNATGVNGVSFMPAYNKYRAYINFKRKQYHLGMFYKLEDAVDARKLAEKEIYGEFLAWYEEYKKTLEDQNEQDITK